MAPVLGGTRPTYGVGYIGGTWGPPPPDRIADPPSPDRIADPPSPYRIADPPSPYRIADPPIQPTASPTRQNQERHLLATSHEKMSRPPRIKGFNYRGAYRYFITFCTLERRAVFTDIALGRSVVLQFRRTCRQEKFEMLAYCLMPDHAHLLLEGMDAASSLVALIKSAKQSSGQRFAARMKPPLWEEGFHDHVLRPEEDPKRFARYIIENPVRAGLVTSPFDYPLSGSDRWTIQELVDSLC